MLVLCTGTATEVGKTWTGAATLRELRTAGHRVSARKPAQSFDPDDDAPLDSEVLAAATGEHPREVCADARTYPLPMAPPMAADALGRPAPTMRDLLDELVWPEPAPQVCWLEAVGGPRSPLAVDGDTIALARALTPRKVVLVADAGLGTISATLLSLAPFLELGLQPVVLLNRFDANDHLHRRNADWLLRHDVVALLSGAALADVLARAI